MVKELPKTYWAFQTDLLKEDVRDILSSILCEHLRIDNPNQPTNWRFDIYRAEEFEKGLSLSQQHEKLNHLRGWEGADSESHLLSTTNMLKSYFNAQNQLNSDYPFQTFVEKAKERDLNYIIRASHKEQFPSAAYNGSVVILGDLTGISLNLAKTEVSNQSKNFRNQLFGYFEISEKTNFKIIDALGNNLLL